MFALQRATHLATISRMAALVLYLIILVLGYTFYRAVGCNEMLLGWECIDKTFQMNYEDVTTLLVFAGVLFATGPTVTLSYLFGLSLVMYVAGMMTFAAFGQIPFMFSALNSSATWQPPTVYVYGGAIGLGIAIVVYSLYITRTKYELVVSLLILVALAVIYVTAAIFAQSFNTVFHVHHYQIAFHLCLLVRADYDPPSILLRWMLMGVYTQGIAGTCFLARSSWIGSARRSCPWPPCTCRRVGSGTVKRLTCAVLPSATPTRHTLLCVHRVQLIHLLPCWTMVLAVDSIASAVHAQAGQQANLKLEV